MNRLQGDCYSALLTFQAATVLLRCLTGCRAIQVERGLAAEYCRKSSILGTKCT